MVIIIILKHNINYKYKYNVIQNKENSYQWMVKIIILKHIKYSPECVIQSAYNTFIIETAHVVLINISRDIIVSMAV